MGWFISYPRWGWIKIRVLLHTCNTYIWVGSPFLCVCVCWVVGWGGGLFDVDSSLLQRINIVLIYCTFHILTNFFVKFFQKITHHPFPTKCQSHLQNNACVNFLLVCFTISQEISAQFFHLVISNKDINYKERLAKADLMKVSLPAKEREFLVQLARCFPTFSTKGPDTLRSWVSAYQQVQVCQRQPSHHRTQLLH